MGIIENSDLDYQIKQIKKRQNTIVFTNGCFDLLHKGHIDLLNEASTFGDILIVGLNSDNSVKSLKGKGRPIENEIIRSKKLLEISIVDFVIIFNSETPEDLIIKIMPDVLVKGGDYNKNDIVGSNEVISAGRKVKIVPLTKGYSTTSIIKSRKV
jgi:D-beta-D-heptose 7-phosphate kinase/D-beta-D-heptose 1-phosphate adenosyltransferase